MESSLRYRHCDRGSEFAHIPIYHLESAIMRSIPSFRRQDKLDPEMNLDNVAEKTTAALSEFCWSLYFDPPFIVRLMYSGYLPICTRLDDSVYCLLPKLHRNRTIWLTSEILHVPKKVRKHAHKYALSINRDFRGVVAGIHEQHGESCWLFPPLENALTDIATYRYELPPNCSVSVVSVELWSVDDNRLVAGEIGYTVGSIYTSMTGFYRDNGSGSVQLAALGGLLRRLSFDLWDFGMMMEYKRNFGCREIPRNQFIESLRLYRDKYQVGRCIGLGQDRLSVMDLISELKNSR
jgi:Leu/Phe-tRNA-protein transferase